MLTILLVILLLVLLLNYNREGFANDAQLSTFLTTWSLTNQELKNTMDVTDDRITFNKEIAIKNGPNKGNTHFNYAADGKNYIRGNETIIDTPTNITTNTKINEIEFLKNWTGEVTNTKSILANDTNKYKALMIAGNNSSGVRKVKVFDQLDVNNKLCIGNTCLTEDHFKVLAGKRDLNIYASDGNHWRYMDCGAREHGKRVCYRHGTTYSGWGNGWQKFRLKAHLGAPEDNQLS